MAENYTRLADTISSHEGKALIKGAFLLCKKNQES